MQGVQGEEASVDFAEHGKVVVYVLDKILSDASLKQQINAVFASLVGDLSRDFAGYLDEVAGSEAEPLMLALREVASNPHGTLGRTGLSLGQRFAMSGFSEPLLSKVHQGLTQSLLQVLGLGFMTARVTRSWRFVLERLFDAILRPAEQSHALSEAQSSPPTPKSSVGAASRPMIGRRETTIGVSRKDSGNQLPAFPQLPPTPSTPQKATLVRRATDQEVFTLIGAQANSNGGPLNVERDEILIQDGIVKAASFPMMVECLTSVYLLDIDDVLLTYRAYATPNDLLKALIERFNNPLGNLDQQKQARFKVLNVIKRWTKVHWRDFSKFPETIAHCTAFLGDVSKANSPFSSTANIILATIQKSSVEPKSSYEDFLPAFAQLKNLRNDICAVFNQFKPDDIAKQLTLLEWGAFQQLQSNEFHDMGWLKQDKKDRAPNKRFNVMSNWVKTALLTTEKLKHRVQLVKKFVALGYALKELKNYNGVMEIVSGLDSGPVYRMKETMEAITTSKKFSGIFAELKALTSSKKNFATLRDVIKEDLSKLAVEGNVGKTPNTRAIIPYLGMYLSDLLFIEEGNPRMIKGMINIAKSQLTAKVLTLIQQLQDQKVDIGRPNHEMQILLFNMKTVSDDDQYLLSNYLEPKEGKEQPPRPGILDEFVPFGQVLRRTNSQIFGSERKGSEDKASALPRHLMPKSRRESETTTEEHSDDEDDEYNFTRSTNSSGSISTPKPNPATMTDLSRRRKLISDILSKFADPGSVRALARIFYPLLFSTMAGAQDMFESALGNAEPKMVETLAHLLQMVGALSEDPDIMKSDNFSERGKKYAGLGITEKMFDQFVSVFVKSLVQFLGNMFSSEYVKAWTDHLNMISTALYAAGEQDEYIGALSMIDQSKVPSRVTMKLSLRKLTLYGNSMELMGQFDAPSIYKVYFPVDKKPPMFKVVLPKELVLTFQAKSAPDLLAWEDQFRKCLSNDYVAIVNNMDEANALLLESGGRTASTSTSKANRAPVVNKKPSAFPGVSESCRVLLTDNAKVQALVKLFFAEASSMGVEVVQYLQRTVSEDWKRFEMMRRLLSMLQQTAEGGLETMEQTPGFSDRAKMYSGLNLSVTSFIAFCKGLVKCIRQVLGEEIMTSSVVKMWSELLLKVYTSMLCVGDGHSIYKRNGKVFAEDSRDWRHCQFSVYKRMILIDYGKETLVYDRFDINTFNIPIKGAMSAFEIRFNNPNTTPLVVDFHTKTREMDEFRTQMQTLFANTTVKFDKNKAALRLTANDYVSLDSLMGGILGLGEDDDDMDAPKQKKVKEEKKEKEKDKEKEKEKNSKGDMRSRGEESPRFQASSPRAVVSPRSPPPQQPNIVVSPRPPAPLSSFPARTASDSELAVKRILRIMILGLSGTGRSTLIQRLSKGVVNPKIVSNSNQDERSEEFEFEGNRIILVAPIVSFNQNFGSLVARLAPIDGCIFLYDISDKMSFIDLSQYWLAGFDGRMPTILCGNRLDQEEREVSPDMINQFAATNKVNVVNVSALTGQNCNALMRALLSVILKPALPSTPNILTTQPGAQIPMSTQPYAPQSPSSPPPARNPAPPSTPPPSQPLTSSSSMVVPKTPSASNLTSPRPGIGIGARRQTMQKIALTEDLPADVAAYIKSLEGSLKRLNAPVPPRPHRYISHEEDGGDQ